MYKEEKQKIIQYCKYLYDKNLVSGFDGNISMKVSEKHILITKSKINKGMLSLEDILVCNLEGSIINGVGGLSKEFPMHRNIYNMDEKVNAIIHSHPPYVTAFAVAGKNIPANCLVETKVILEKTYLVPYAKPGSEMLANAVEAGAKVSSVLLMENHGALVYGSDMDEAYNKMEIVENVAKTIIMSRLIGEPKKIKYDHALSGIS